MKNELRKSSRVAELITQGIEAWLEAGKILVELLDDGKSLESISEECGLSEDILYRFEQIGRKSLHPQLLANTSAGARALSSCGYSTQSKYIKEPVKLLLNNGETLLVKVENMTASQVKQAFASGHVRSEGEQRAYIEAMEEKRRAQSIVTENPYEISGRKVVFRQGVSMTKDELIHVLGRLA